MEIWHRISFGHRDGVDDAIESLAIKHEKSPLPGGGYLIHLDITESDPRWPEIAYLVEEKKPVDMVCTIFSSEEVLKAEWVRLVVTFERGYPQPEEGWEQLTYENECPQCGTGYRQKAAFRLKKEPRMGRHDFLSLYWTRSVFCVPQVVETFRAHQVQGYDEWKAIIHKTNQPSEVVTQLVFSTVAQPALAEEDKLRPETCPQCGLTRYAYHKRGYMHLKREALPSDTDFLLTDEWFGGGGYSGFREILVSNRLAAIVLEQGWRGVTLKPVKLF
jgi:hypothetical protein